MESISVIHTEDYLSHSEVLERPGSRRRSGTFQLVRGRFTGVWRINQHLPDMLEQKETQLEV